DDVPSGCVLYVSAGAVVSGQKNDGPCQSSAVGSAAGKDCDFCLLGGQPDQVLYLVGHHLVAPHGPVQGGLVQDGPYLFTGYRAGPLHAGSDELADLVLCGLRASFCEDGGGVGRCLENSGDQEGFPDLDGVCLGF